MAFPVSRTHALTNNFLYVADLSVAPNDLNTPIPSTLARWNGNKNDALGGWVALGSSIGGTLPRTRVVFPVNDNEVYVCGNFTSIDGVPANHVAMWKGDGFVGLDSPIDGEVQTLVYDPVHDRLYAASHTTVQRLYYCTLTRTAGSVTGGTWTTMDVGGRIDAINIMETDGYGRIYIGGFATTMGSFVVYDGNADVWMPPVYFEGTTIPVDGLTLGIWYSPLLQAAILVCLGNFRIAIYDPTAGVLRLFPSILPPDLWMLTDCCVDLSRNIYLAGNVSGDTYAGYQLCRANYDPLAETWTTATPLSEPSDPAGFHDVLVDSVGNIYGRTETSLFRVMDVTTSTWSSSTASLSDDFTIGDNIYCYLNETPVLVRQADGTELYVPVEDVSEGQILVTTKGTTTVRGKRRFEYRKSLNVLPFIIPANSLGPEKPFQDLYLSPNHCFWDEDRNCWVHMNHSWFPRADPTEISGTVVYYHLYTDDYRNDIIYVAGIPTETWDREETIVSWNCDVKNHRCIRLLKTTD